MAKSFIEIIQDLFKGKGHAGSPAVVSSQTANLASISTPSSLDLVYDLVHERIVAQKEQRISLDVKINFILSYATALVSASLILQAVLLTLHRTSGSLLFSLVPFFPAQIVSTILLLSLLVFYIITVVLGIFAYKPRTYFQVPEPMEIYQQWVNKEEAETKQEMTRLMVKAYQDNAVELNKKVRLIDYALATLFVEAFLLVPLIIIQVVS